MLKSWGQVMNEDVTGFDGDCCQVSFSTGLHPQCLGEGQVMK